MLKYTLKRIGAMVPVMLIISVVVFLIIYLTPGDPASSMLGMEASADQIERVNDSLGLNRCRSATLSGWAACLPAT